MKIQPVRLSRINFGYNLGLNKELSAKLDERLEYEPKSPEYTLMKSLRDTCNKTEDIIRDLEESPGGIYDNCETINILLDSLIPNKVYLAELVARFIPGLNFINRERDHYDAEAEENGDKKINEQDEQDEQDSEEDPEIAKAQHWRARMSNALEYKHTVLVDNSITEDHIKELLKNVEGDMEDIGESKIKDVGSILTNYKVTEDSPSLDDILGSKDAIYELRKNVVEPIIIDGEAQRRFEGYGLDKIPHFVLLQGPPGCGKTMISKAIAKETGCKMYMLDVAKFGSQYINASAKNISEIFKAIENEAKGSEKPIIIFMDEIDSIMSKRMTESGADREENKVISKILTWTNELKGKNIIVIGATNFASALDDAGKDRMDAAYYIGMLKPDEIVILLKKELLPYSMTRNLAQNEDELKEIAEKLKKYSPRTILKILTSAKTIACNNERELSASDIDTSLQTHVYREVNEKIYMPQERKFFGFS